jgi:hypothetical protein
MTKRAWIVPVVLVAAIALSGCGGSRSLLTARDAERAFRTHGFALRVVVDSRKLSQAQVYRLTKIAPGDIGAVRAAKLALRASLEKIRARAAGHPVEWLTSSSQPVEINDGVDVLVWGNESDATTNESTAQRGLGGAGSRFAPVRVRNVVVMFPTASATTTTRAKAAVQSLRHQ